MPSFLVQELQCRVSNQVSNGGSDFPPPARWSCGEESDFLIGNRTVAAATSSRAQFHGPIVILTEAQDKKERIFFIYFFLKFIKA